MSEQDLGALFVQRVAFDLPHVRVFRRQVLNVETKQGWRARAGVKGQADYYAIARGGRHVELETKSARHKWYAEQRAWRSWCVEFGVPYLELRARAGELPEATVARWISELRSVLEAPT